MSVDEEKLVEYKRELEGKKGALREFANKVSSENRNPRYVSTDSCNDNCVLGHIKGGKLIESTVKKNTC